jgi:hypothetical protein
LLHAAELDERPAASFCGRHAGAKIVIDVHLQMTVQLGGDFVTCGADADQAAKTDPKGSEGPH